MKKAYGPIEALLSFAILLIASVTLIKVSTAMSDMSVRTKNTIFLAAHNLNCSEMLKEKCRDLGESESLLNYYGPDEMSIEGYISTEIFVTKYVCNSVNVYELEITSEITGTNQNLRSIYTITDITY